MSRAARTLGCLLAVLGFAVATLPAQVLVSPLTEHAYAGEAESLTISMTSITPSTLIPGRPVQVAGSVTNSDTAPWTHLQVSLVLSPKPMTSATELDRALASDADALIGPRIISTSPKQTWVEMGDLAPGATKSYQLDVAYRKLGISGSAASTGWPCTCSPPTLTGTATRPPMRVPAPSSPSSPRQPGLAG